MSHEDKGNFAAKHPQDTVVSTELRQALEKKVHNQSITCAAAHKVARNLNISPAQVGVAFDMLEYRLCKCQMGLFGYEPEKKIVKPAADVSPELERSITAHLQGKRLPCLAAWRIAEKEGLSRLECSCVCEALKVKISPCQLGAF